MAKPIVETPVLEKEDAKRFLDEVENKKNIIVSKEIKKRIFSNYKLISAIARF